MVVKINIGPATTEPPSEVWPNVEQLMRKQWLETVIGFTARHADCRMISKLYQPFFIRFDNFYGLITQTRFSNNSFES